MAAAEQYEIEIKSLLGDESAADAFRRALKETYPTCEVLRSEKQLNHYFKGGDIAMLAEHLAPRLSEENREKLGRIVNRASAVSVRTREVDGNPRLVVKASLGDDSSANGVVRVEVDAPIEGLSLAELDGEICAAQYAYEAKWSRAREEYEIDDVTICIDRNAGYGYLAEFEKITDDSSRIEEMKAQVIALMERLGAKELPQDRLERMFAHYNAHWPEYYGTDKVFTIH